MKKNIAAALTLTIIGAEALGISFPRPALAADALAADALQLYAAHCAGCHHAERLGAMGAALLPENLGRLGKEEAAKVIAEGRPATQMQGFKDKLAKEDIDALVVLIYTPLRQTPAWGEREIKASRVIHNPLSSLPGKPQHQADPLNLFTVVETGDHHVTILDGDKFEPLWRFQSRFALHGGAKYSPDGRFLYLGSRDGWVSKYDLHSLKPVAETRAGINTRNIAVSTDGQWVMVGNYLPHSLVVLNAADLSLSKIISTDDGSGLTSRVSAVYNAPPRKSFVAAMKDFKELWELSYDKDAKPVSGLVHSYREGEKAGIKKPLFTPRRVQLDDYLDDFFFNPNYTEVIGASRDGKTGIVYDLDLGRKVAGIELGGMPHLSSGITWEYQGRPVMATPHLKDAAVSVIDMKSWKTIKKIETKGSGFFMRSHENTPYAWVDVFFGPNKGILHVIDKRTLEIIETINPEPGKTSAHVEFTRNGGHALVSIWEMDGAVVVYDAATLKEVKRIPMKKPSGKYNVYNKITYSAGTSH